MAGGYGRGWPGVRAESACWGERSESRAAARRRVACVRVDGPWAGGHLRSRVWRSTRPVSAAARDVAPDGPMSLELCMLQKQTCKLFIRDIYYIMHQYGHLFEFERRGDAALRPQGRR